MFTRHSQDTAARRNCFNKSSRFQNSLAVLLILCLCITSTSAVTADMPLGLDMSFGLGMSPGFGMDEPYIGRSFQLRECVDGKPEEGLNACPCRNDNDFGFGHNIWPVEPQELTWTDRCTLGRRCTSSPQCCVDLCDSNSEMICENENDCRTIRDGNVFWACIGERKCLQWNDEYTDHCASGSSRTPTGTHCFCRKYDRRCST